MSSEDFQPDIAWKTPSGIVLNKFARNPHFNVDIVHGALSGGTGVQPVQFEMQIPDIPNGNSFIETISPPIVPTESYSASLSGEYNDEPLVLINIERISPTSFRVEIQNQSGITITARSVVINFS